MDIQGDRTSISQQPRWCPSPLQGLSQGKARAHGRRLCDVVRDSLRQSIEPDESHGLSVAFGGRCRGGVRKSTNNRGKKPNHLDRLKNDLLFLASKLGAELNPKLTAEINKAWETIFKQLSAAGRPDDEETLLQMHWLTVYDHDMKHWDTEKEKSDLIKRRFSLVNYLDRYDELYQELVVYVRTLSNAAIAYSDLRKPARPDAFQIYANAADIRTDIVRYSEKLLRLGILRPFQPLLIAARLRSPDYAAQYLQVVKLCERYAFRVFAIAERRANSKEAVLFRLGNLFYNSRVGLTELDETLRRDLLRECTDILFKNSFSPENPTTLVRQARISLLPVRIRGRAV